jgi:hypothetical protein
MKEKNKVKSEYGYNFKIGGDFESFEVEQEEGVLDRNAVLVKLYQERWRTPEQYVEFLEKVKIIIKRDFISPLP